MPKYQIILSSDEQIPDDEFKAKVLDELENMESLGLSGFVLVEARNLEGIRKELWEKRDNAIENVCGPDQSVVEETFDEISNIFKLNE